MDRIVEVPCGKEGIDPNEAVDVFCHHLNKYNITKVLGDEVGGRYTESRFRSHNILYDSSAPPKSELYNQFLPIIKMKIIELPDNEVLKDQAVSLIRKPDKWVKPKLAKDDVINAVAGLAWMLFENIKSKPTEMESLMKLPWKYGETKELRMKKKEEGEMEERVLASLREKGIDL